MVKEIKNPDSPGGRKDWEGRTPRVRLSCTMKQLVILNELLKEHYLKHPEDEFGSDYEDLHLRIVEHIKTMETPLMAEVEDFGLYG